MYSMLLAFVTSASGDRMRKMILALLLTAVLAACSGITIGPVDSSCHVNPRQGSEGSGCS